MSVLHGVASPLRNSATALELQANKYQKKFHQVPKSIFHSVCVFMFFSTHMIFDHKIKDEMKIKLLPYYK